MRFTFKKAAVAAAAVVLTGGALTAGTASAADQTPQFRTVHTAAGDYTELWIGNAGAAIWNADPSGSIPGDALRAYDGAADGHGINAYLDRSRKASTAGHTSPYYSPWVTGDLPEGSSHTLTACLVKGGVESNCWSATVTA